MSASHANVYKLFAGNKNKNVININVRHLIHQVVQAGVIQVIFHGSLSLQCFERCLLSN